MRILAAFAILAAIWSGNAAAYCGCQCVNGFEQAVCSSTNEKPPYCGANNCPAPSVMTPKPRSTGSAQGTYGCDFMAVYSRTTKEHYWSELCTSSGRNGVMLVRPSMVLPVPNVAGSARRYAAPGPLCNTDSDCPSASSCTRRSQNDEWRCRAR